MKRFIQIFSVLAVIGIFLVTVSVATAQQPTMQKPQGMQEMQKPPAKPLPVKCPDVVVTDVEVKLVSTEIEKPGVEFPTDKVAIYFKINNIGTIETPSKFDVYVYRKNEPICGMTIGTIQPQESTGPYSCPDSFPHGVHILQDRCQ